MRKQLFITCPFSHAETFLRRLFPGTDAFFLSAVAGNAAGLDAFTLEETADLIRREHIRSICIVSDVACPFIDEVVQERCSSGLEAEKLLRDIYIDHYFTHFRNQSLPVKKKNLARLQVEYQLELIEETAFLGSLIRQNGINLKGLVTNRMGGWWKIIEAAQAQENSPAELLNG